MKRVLAVILTLVLIISVTCVSAYAYEPNPDPPSLQELFEQEYGQTQFFEIKHSHECEDIPVFIDWALIHTATEIMVEPIENPEVKYSVVGDIVYGTIFINEPFRVPYCVYDALDNEFYDISSVDFDDYVGLREVFCTAEYGQLIGDVNGDTKISVVDATNIQRIVAQLDDSVNFYVSDFNRDRAVDILDATAIQRKVAKVEEEPEYNAELVYSPLNDMVPNDGIWQEIEFETLYNGKQEIEDCKMPDSTFVAIIKTKEQYDQIFNVYNDVYDEEFFEQNNLVASVYQVTDENMVAQISKLYMSYNEFIIDIDTRIINDSGIALPTAPPYYSFASVSKESVNDAKWIVWI